MSIIWGHVDQNLLRIECENGICKLSQENKNKVGDNLGALSVAANPVADYGTV